MSYITLRPLCCAISFYYRRRSLFSFLMCVCVFNVTRSIYTTTAFNNQQGVALCLTACLQLAALHTHTHTHTHWSAPPADSPDLSVTEIIPFISSRAKADVDLRYQTCNALVAPPVTQVEHQKCFRILLTHFFFFWISCKILWNNKLAEQWNARAKTFCHFQ